MYYKHWILEHVYLTLNLRQTTLPICFWSVFSFLFFSCPASLLPYESQKCCWTMVEKSKLPIRAESPIEFSHFLSCRNRRIVILTIERTEIHPDLCATCLLFFSVSWCVPSSPAFCTSASWLPSPGCVWRGCSCTSCSSTCLRASSHAGNTTTSLGTSPPLWWWASRPPSTTGATGRSECESPCI